MIQDRRADHTLFYAPVPVGADRDGAVDRMQDLLDEWMAYQSGHASTPAEITQVAEDAATILLHRPLEVEVLSHEDAAGVREVGFHTTEGAYIGVEAPLLACHAHTDLSAWPCVVIQSLVTRMTS